mmetsp:Transcript_9503/g.28939  ORF Transcript_9503/g.28939 Transcript_9503/m.28939 type:complete len:319 (+) Transcript_9503:760-1716(+)
MGKRPALPLAQLLQSLPCKSRRLPARPLHRLRRPARFTPRLSPLVCRPRLQVATAGCRPRPSPLPTCLIVAARHLGPRLRRRLVACRQVAGGPVQTCLRQQPHRCRQMTHTPPPPYLAAVPRQHLHQSWRGEVGRGPRRIQAFRQLALAPWVRLLWCDARRAFRPEARTPTQLLRSTRRTPAGPPLTLTWYRRRRPLVQRAPLKAQLAPWRSCGSWHLPFGCCASSDALMPSANSARSLPLTMLRDGYSPRLAVPTMRWCSTRKRFALLNRSKKSSHTALRAQRSIRRSFGTSRGRKPCVTWPSAPLSSIAPRPTPAA